MIRLAFLFSLAGCFSKPSQPAAHGDGGGDVATADGQNNPCTGTETYVDMFNSTPAVCANGVTASGGNLSMTPGAMTATSCSFDSTALGKGVRVHISQFIHDGDYSDTELETYIAGGGSADDVWIELYNNNGYKFAMKDGGGFAQEMAWDPATPVWWALEITGPHAVTGAYSADGVNWTPIHTSTVASMTDQPSLINLAVNATTASATAIFDHLQTCQ